MVVLGKVCTGEVEFVVGHSQTICGKNKTNAVQRLSGAHHRLCPMIQWLLWRKYNLLMPLMDLFF